MRLLVALMVVCCCKVQAQDIGAEETPSIEIVIADDTDTDYESLREIRDFECGCKKGKPKI